MKLNDNGLAESCKQQCSIRTGMSTCRRQEAGQMQAQAKGRKEDRRKHRRKAGRRIDASTGTMQEGRQAQAQAKGRKGRGGGGDLQVCSHVASGLTHNSLPWHLGVVLQALHRGPVEGHCCRLEGGREDGLEAWLVCLQLAGHMHKEAEEEGRGQAASELHHAACDHVAE